MNALQLLPLRRPLVSVETARAVLSKSEDEILDLIYSGALLYAFNVASENCRRRQVRIFVPSLGDYVNQTKHQPAALDGVLKYLFPASTPTVRASAFARVINASSSHVHSLIKRRELVKVADGGYSRATPLIAKSSAVKFLETRRIT